MEDHSAWKTAPKRVRQVGRRLRAAVDSRLGGRLELVVRTWRAAAEHQAPLQARSIAYYALFSLFPLLLFLVAVTGSLLDSQETKQTILDEVSRSLPAAEGFVRDDIDRVLRARGTAGALGLLGLMWSGSGVFGSIYRGVNRAWGNSGRRVVLVDRLFGLAIVLGLGLILVLMVLSSTALEVVRSWEFSILGWQPSSSRWVGILLGWGSAIVQVAVTLLLLVLVYRFVPRAAVEWRDAWPGALVAALIWEGFKRFFTWYLVNIARHSLVYGSVGTIIGFMLWSYISALILLLGAEFTAQYSRWRTAGRPVQGCPPG